MKLDKLTTEQEKVLDIVKKEYIDLAFSGKEIDRVEATKGIKWLYKFSSLKEPIIIFLDSPIACQIGAEYAIQLLKHKPELTQNQVWSQVENQVRNQVENQVRNQVWSQVGNQVWSQVWSQVENQVWSQVGNQVWSQVGNQVWSQVWSQVENQVRNQVGKTKIEHRFFSSYGNIWDYGWLSFYTVFEQLGIDLGESKKDFLKFRSLIKSGVFNMIQLDGLCIVSSLPSKILTNPRGFMHSEISAAIQFRDGYNQHYLNGVYFDEDLFKKVTSKDFSFGERMKIVDIDQRTQAINPKFCDIDAFIKEAKGELLDEVNKYDINGDVVNYRLYMFPKDQIFTENAYYCYFDCPSTNKKHLEGVEVSKTVAEAMSWAEEITQEEWRLRIPLKHEN